ncbi:MAG: GNAT family N-acetyltransferase [Deltaproteobacteria bacterium]|nr:GNAT family N-acetyltransferase [Deltaproteobacteria bacterium]
MRKSEMLRDGTEIILRDYTPADMDASYRFYQRLAPEERAYMRIDVTRRDVLERQFRDVAEGRAVRLVAMAGDELVGTGVVELSPISWDSHRGELRLSVAPEYRNKGLGRKLVTELFREAKERGVQKAVARFMPEQGAIRGLLEHLGWHMDAVLPGFVRDQTGTSHDQVVMSCTMDECWEELQGYYSSDDWPDG